LDEIADLPALLQAKLLRVLEQSEVTPLGEPHPVPVDVRVLAAAQEPISVAVSENRFRADLYARLDGLIVQLPPLRDRVEDIPGLFSRFLHEGSGGKPPMVEPKLVERLCLYDWPYNVRELALQTRRLLALYGHESLLRRSHLSEQIRFTPPMENNGPSPSSQPASSKGDSEASMKPADRNERDFAALIEALREYRGNVARAAASIGISRQRAYRIMEGRDEIDLEAFRDHDSSS
jgi:two-component system response regulator PilR (NtrC family)